MDKQLVKTIVPYIWARFKVYLNDPSYFVRGTDVLASVFGKGEVGVKQFIKDINHKLTTLAVDNKKPKKVKYKSNMTYHDVLTNFVKL